MARVIECDDTSGTVMGVGRAPITKTLLIAGGILLVVGGYAFRISGRVASLILGAVLVSTGGILLIRRWNRRGESAVSYVTLLLRESLPEEYVIAHRFPLKGESGPRIEWLVLGPGGVYLVEQREDKETPDELRGRLRRERRRLRDILDEIEDPSVPDVRLEILGVDRRCSPGQGEWLVHPGELVERIRSTESLPPDAVQELRYKLGLEPAR